MRIAAAPQFDPSSSKQPFYLCFAEGDFRSEAVTRNPLQRSHVAKQIRFSNLAEKSPLGLGKIQLLYPFPQSAVRNVVHAEPARNKGKGDDSNAG